MELDVVETVVHFVAEDHDLVLDTDVSDLLKLGLAEDLANGIVWVIEDYHLRPRCDGSFQFGEVNAPFGCRTGLGGSSCRRVQGNTFDHSTWHPYTVQIPIDHSLRIIQ